MGRRSSSSPYLNSLFNHGGGEVETRLCGTGARRQLVMDPRPSCRPKVKIQKVQPIHKARQTNQGWSTTSSRGSLCWAVLSHWLAVCQADATHAPSSSSPRRSALRYACKAELTTTTPGPAWVQRAASSCIHHERRDTRYCPLPVPIIPWRDGSR